MLLAVRELTFLWCNVDLSGCPFEEGGEPNVAFI